MAKETLAEMLRDGKLRARAAEAWGADTSDILGNWEGNAEHDPEEEIQSDFQQSVQWADDIDSWRWPDSFFMVTVSRRPLECLYYRDVTFLRSDLANIGASEPTPRAFVAKGGRRTDLHRWENFWFAVIQTALDGNLIPGHFESQARLREELIDAVGEDGLKEDSLKAPVRRIWYRFCEPES